MEITYETDDPVAWQQEGEGNFVASLVMLITRKEYSIRASTENRQIGQTRFVTHDGLTYPELFGPIMEKLTALCQPTEITIDDRLGWEHGQVFAE